jgi:hypothetical protein
MEKCHMSPNILCKFAKHFGSAPISAKSVMQNDLDVSSCTHVVDVLDFDKWMATSGGHQRERPMYVLLQEI